MEFVVVVCILAAFLQVALADEETESFTSEEESCIKNHKLDKTKIEFILNKESNYLPEDDLDFMQFLSCFWKQNGYLDERGIINYEKLIEFIKDLPKERFGGNYGNVGIQIATEAVDSCRNVLPGKFPGQTAAKTQNCITRQIKEYVEEDRSV